MALQDLTPQLRTRLSRMERAVGWFVFLATALLLFAFGYYIYHQAEQKGWFKIKAPFFTYVDSSAGLHAGDDVMMMGFAVGKITNVDPEPPGYPHNVKVKFYILDNKFRYIWSGGSYIKLNSADFLGKRQLEVTRGTNGYAICVTQPVSIMTLDDARRAAAAAPDHWQLAQDVLDAETSNVVFKAYQPVSEVLADSNATVLAHCLFPSNSIHIYDNTVNRNRIVASWHKHTHSYENFTPDSEDAWLKVEETPPIGDQLQAMVSQVQAALPAVIALTNKLATILDNAANATSNLNNTLASVQPLVANFAGISGQLREPGGLGVWALGTNGNLQIQGALTNLNVLLVNTDTNLNALSDQVGLTLENIAGITSNLNAQVQANSNMLWGISKTVTDSDDFVQGLKRHWLLRSAFKKPKSTNTPPATVKSKQTK